MQVFQLSFNNQDDLARYLKQMGLHTRGIEIISQKLSCYTIKVSQLKGSAANILKQEALSIGAECAVPYDTLKSPDDLFPVLILSDKYRLQKLIQKLKLQEFKSLKQLASKLQIISDRKYPHDFKFHKREISSPLLMGILNATPDSFSDGGKFNEPESAREHCLSMISAGADIIDIGGESTRPGASEISIEEELSRVMPIIDSLNDQDIVLSIDTSKAEVARQAAEKGVEIINDISGFQSDPQIADVVAKYNCHAVLMHRSAASTEMQKRTDYQDLIPEILDYLQNSIDIALRAGVSPEKIIIDPGIGFGKTAAQNLEILKNIRSFRSLGFPVLLGVSRKSVIGQVLDINSPTERDFGTITATAHAIINQVDIIRVHDVKANRQVLKMTEAILRGEI